MELTAAQIGKKYEVHPQQVSVWKKQALEGLPEIFTEGHRRADREVEQLISRLYEQIGQLKVELDWVKKKSGLIS